MTGQRQPPVFQGSLREWAAQVTSYLWQVVPDAEQAAPVQLAIRQDALGSSAAGRGVLMLCPDAMCVVFSLDGEWIPLARRDRFQPTPGAELTIATGVITATEYQHPVDTESDAASDNLDTITAGSSGQQLLLHTVDAGRDVVLTESGNIVIPGGTTLTLGDPSESVVLRCDGTNWIVVSTTGTIA